MLARLRVAAARGYPLAIPWSYRGVDRHTAWSPAVERDLEAFAREQMGITPQTQMDRLDAAVVDRPVRPASPEERDDRVGGSGST